MLILQTKVNKTENMGFLVRCALLVLVWKAGGGAAQPTCSDDGHCGEGFYCENFTCRQCLKCKDFKRETPSNPSECIKSVVDCGPCMKGLIVDSSSDVSAACVPPQESLGATWIAVTVVVAVALILLTCVLIPYILRKKGIFKMHAYLGASVESQQELPRPSAPAELPPPYARFDASHPAPNGAVESSDRPGERAENGAGALHQPQQQPTSPSPYDGVNAYTINEEASQPFIKRASPPPISRPQAPAGRQNARVFNRPAYVYPSYNKPTVTEDADQNVVNLHDEETMESPWTPAQEQTDGSENAMGPAVLVTDSAGGHFAQLDAARGTVLVRPPRDHHQPPAKKKCFPHDSNNNGNQAGSGEPSMSGGSASASATTTAIKVNMQATLQLNTIHQHDSGHRHSAYKGDTVPR